MIGPPLQRCGLGGQQASSVPSTAAIKHPGAVPSAGGIDRHLPACLRYPAVSQQYPFGGMSEPDGQGIVLAVNVGYWKPCRGLVGWPIRSYDQLQVVRQARSTRGCQMSSVNQKSSWKEVGFIVIAAVVGIGLYAQRSGDNQAKEECRIILEKPPFNCSDYLASRDGQVKTYEDGSSSGPTMRVWSDTCAVQADLSERRRSACTADPTSGGRFN